METLKAESEKTSLFSQAIAKEGAIENFDERRVMLLKAQNA